MKDSATLLKGGILVSGSGVARGDLLFENGRIVEVDDAIHPGSAKEVVDCRGKYVFPGIIDPHTHMGIPIKDIHSADDFASGSRAALHGGVTTILDFTVLHDGETLHESVQRRSQEARGSVVDVGLHVNVTRADDAILAEIGELASGGFTSFKVFTTYREAGMMLEYGDIERVAHAVAEAGGLLMVHAEDDATLQAAGQGLDRTSSDPLLHARSRPPDAEAEAVRRLGTIAERTGCPVYIVHLSSAPGLAAAVDFPALRVETCPQYLLLTENAYKREDGRMFVASPPLRTDRDREALWEGVMQGWISTIGTDHCPFLLRDKPSGQPFGKIPNGIGGVETLFPLLLAHVLTEGHDPRPACARSLRESGGDLRPCRAERQAALRDGRGHCPGRSGRGRHRLV